MGGGRGSAGAAAGADSAERVAGGSGGGGDRAIVADAVLLGRLRIDLEALAAKV